MTATVEIRNIFINQGCDVLESFDYPGAADGDTAQAQMRRWAANGPLQVTFAANVDVEAQTVTVALDAVTSATVLRNGWYDVQVVNGLETVTIARGFAKLVPAITSGSSGSSRMRWGQLRFNQVTWGQLRRRKWSQL